MPQPGTAEPVRLHSGLSFKASCFFSSPAPGQDSELQCRLSQLLLEHILLRTLLLQHLQHQREEGDGSREGGGREDLRDQGGGREDLRDQGGGREDLRSQGGGREDQQSSESRTVAAPAAVASDESPAQQPWPVTSLLPGNQLEDHTPASAPRHEDHTPASAPRHENHTPALAPRQEDHTPASAPRQEDHTPASAPRQEDHTPASNRQESCSTTDVELRTSCVHNTSCSLAPSRAFSRARTLPAAVSNSATRHHSSECTTSHPASRSNTVNMFASPTSVHWTSRDSPSTMHQTAYNSQASLALPNRHPPGSRCVSAVHHDTMCSMVSGHRGPQMSQPSPAVPPSPLTTWATPPAQGSQQTIVQPWVSNTHSATHLRHLPHSLPSQRPRMSYPRRDRHTRASQPYHTGTRPHQATSCQQPSGRGYSSHLLSAATAAYGHHPSAVETNTPAYAGYTHSAELPPHYQHSYGYRMPANAPPPLSAYSSPPVAHCNAPSAQRHPYPSPLPQSQGAVWRPYSDSSRSSGFCLADIISLPPSGEQLGPPPPPHNPSFLMDHLLDDI